MESGPPASAVTQANDAQTTTGDPDLQVLIDAWSRLPEVLKRGILAMVAGVLSKTDDE
jgi:hypothetical protein